MGEIRRLNVVFFIGMITMLISVNCDSRHNNYERASIQFIDSCRIGQNDCIYWFREDLGLHDYSICKLVKSNQDFKTNSGEVFFIN